ncbi:hypothetical protein Tco_0509515 [Tanacetum coccineum]
MVFGKLIEAYIVANKKVLHKIVNVVERDNTVEQLVMTVVDNERVYIVPKNNWFTQPPRPPTLDLQWNKVKAVDDTQEQTWFNDMLSAEKDPLTFDELMATPVDFSKFAMNRLKIDKLTQADLVGPVYELLNSDWENPKGDRCPFDLSKRIPFKGHPCHLTVAAEYFINNDLEYLKSTVSERKYTTSITKKKAARYELVGVEDMIPKQWSVTKVGFSKHDVYSPLKILSVVSVKVNKLHSYGYLEEIVVRRADRQLYKFKEGDFINLHLNDIEDMLLLVVQHNLFHLDGDVIVDLAYFSLIIKKRVEDFQLGVKSYQKKLNITKTQKDFPTISAKEPYTPSFDQQGVFYEDLSNQKRLMRADELYKFSDGTLKSVRDTLHHQLLERWIIRNLERLVGARNLEMDYRLMQRTV